MIFQEELQAICKGVPGCWEAILMNIDGLVVHREVIKDSGLDAEVLLVELSTAIKQAKIAMKNAGGGELKELSVHFDAADLVIRFLREDYLVALLLDPKEYTGRGRYMLRRHQHSLSKELS